MLMSPRDREARLYYQPNGFRVLAPGDHVTCAVSGARIALEMLRYWNVARQEPYASAELSTRRALGQA